MIEHPFGTDVLTQMHYCECQTVTFTIGNIRDKTTKADWNVQLNVGPNYVFYNIFSQSA